MILRRLRQAPAPWGGASPTSGPPSILPPPVLLGLRTRVDADGTPNRPRGCPRYIPKSLFPDNESDRYSCNSVAAVFNSIWKAAGLGAGCGNRPRAYDFRHHFALSNLNRWIATGVEASLSQQVHGTPSLASTDYYLHLWSSSTRTPSLSSSRYLQCAQPDALYCDFLEAQQRIKFANVSWDHFTRDSVIKYIQWLRQSSCGVATCNLRPALWHSSDTVRHEAFYTWR